MCGSIQIVSPSGVSRQVVLYVSVTLSIPYLNDMDSYITGIKSIPKLNLWCFSDTDTNTFPVSLLYPTDSEIVKKMKSCVITIVIDSKEAYKMHVDKKGTESTDFAHNTSGKSPIHESLEVLLKSRDVTIDAKISVEDNRTVKLHDIQVHVQSSDVKTEEKTDEAETEHDTEHDTEEDYYDWNQAMGGGGWDSNGGSPQWVPDM